LLFKLLLKLSFILIIGALAAMQTSEPARRINGSRLADKALGVLNFIAVNLFNADILKQWNVRRECFYWYRFLVRCQITALF
jgi:hypothetical protein